MVNGELLHLADDARIQALSMLDKYLKHSGWPEGRRLQASRSTGKWLVGAYGIQGLGRGGRARGLALHSREPARQIATMHVGRQADQRARGVSSGFSHRLRSSGYITPGSD